MVQQSGRFVASESLRLEVWLASVLQCVLEFRFVELSEEDLRQLSDLPACVRQSFGKVHDNLASWGQQNSILDHDLALALEKSFPRFHEQIGSCVRVLAPSLALLEQFFEVLNHRAEVNTLLLLQL